MSTKKYKNTKNYKKDYKKKHRKTKKGGQRKHITDMDKIFIKIDILLRKYNIKNSININNFMDNIDKLLDQYSKKDTINFIELKENIISKIMTYVIIDTAEKKNTIDQIKDLENRYSTIRQ